MRQLYCLEMLHRVLPLPGHVAELGVGAGHVTFPMGQALQELTRDKILYAFDTFSGLPYDDDTVFPDMCRKGELDGGQIFMDAHKAFRQYSERITPVPGLVENTLPTIADNVHFCFAWLDLDLYVPTRVALEWIAPRMVVGGIIGLHDYGFRRCPGIKRAVDETVGRPERRNAWSWEERPGCCLFLTKR